MFITEKWYNEMGEGLLGSSCGYNGVLIVPIFDYYNIIVYKRNTNILSTLHELQNGGGRPLLMWNRYTHSSDIFNILKWLSAEVTLSTVVMMYKYENTKYPQYLYDIYKYQKLM